MRHMDEESRDWLCEDELPKEQKCLLASVDDAESKNRNDYGLLSSHFYYIIQNGEINTSINRGSFTATRIRIRSILSKMGVFYPRYEYRCDGTVM